MCHKLLNPSPTDVYSDCFHVFAINNVVLKNLIHISFPTCVSVSAGKTYRNAMLSQRVCAFLLLINT